MAQQDLRQELQQDLDRRAAAWLLAAAAVGTAVTFFELLSGRQVAFSWADAGVVGLLPAFLRTAIPAGLIFAAYLGVSAYERRVGVRCHRGALALLTGAAVLAVPFTLYLWASPMFGIALLLLALRTREGITAACGFLALAVWWYEGSAVGAEAALLGVAMVMVACGSAAVQLFLAGGRAGQERRAVKNQAGRERH